MIDYGIVQQLLYRLLRDEMSEETLRAHVAECHPGPANYSNSKLERKSARLTIKLLGGAIRPLVPPPRSADAPPPTRPCR